MHGGYSEVHSDCVRMLLKTSTIEIRIVREEQNLPVVFNSFASGKAKKALASNMRSGSCHTHLNALNFSHDIDLVNLRQSPQKSVLHSEHFSNFCGACVGAAKNENISAAQNELLKWHWKLGIGIYSILTNSAHDTGVVSEGEREIARRNWWCNIRPATARIKPSERHIGRPKPAICKASVSAATMTDISESSDRRTWSQPIAGSTWHLPKRVCMRCCVQHQARNLLTRSVSTRLLVSRLTIYRLSKYHRTMPLNDMASAGQLRPTRPRSHLSALAFVA